MASFLGGDPSAGPFGFRAGRGNRRVRAIEASVLGSVDGPGAVAPPCPDDERAKACAALDQMWATKPARPPGRR
jgi:hypothetical protein